MDIVEQLDRKVIKTQKLQDSINRSINNLSSNQSLISDGELLEDDFSRDVDSAID